MEKIMGHAGYHRRVAINVGAGFVPGMNTMLMGAALAAGKLGGTGQMDEQTPDKKRKYDDKAVIEPARMIEERKNAGLRPSCALPIEAILCHDADGKSRLPPKVSTNTRRAGT